MPRVLGSSCLQAPLRARGPAVCGRGAWGPHTHHPGKEAFRAAPAPAPAPAPVTSRGHALRVFPLSTVDFVSEERFKL